eukprot:Phypoly_transcript_02426.p1 GENE.Phypoly_transcript_02426~~Phypoly_transcript_02426.p1  ORF type:complete len:876 (+),score=148.66 Phypoly_transcript_02426:67-2694(+)
MKQVEKKDDDDAFLPFQGLEKGIVLQEKHLFNATPINARKCSALITKLLYLLVQGEKFTRQEATDVFFAVTKLFQSKDIPLRRMMYLMLKELASISDDVIIVISSLTKDINSKIELCHANAIRVLCKIADSSLLPQLERFLKQSIVDKDPHVASSALVSGIHLMKSSPDLIKRWVNEVQEAVNKGTMVQYHALALLHQIKQHDRLAVSKLVASLVRGSVRSPYASCLLIRLAADVMDASDDRTYLDYLEQSLRNKNEMVVYEAARAICSLRNATAKELTPAITVLQLFLSSPKPTLRFAAVRTLNKVAMTHPLAVTTCNLDMENLITDSNRSIATLAITTLLKTGNESSVDRLMKQISNFMGEISDEFKIVVVEAIRVLTIKFPQKHRTLMSFLANILRDEGGFEYKKAIVESILAIITQIPESKEAGLSHLCEFIEDCDFTFLATKILHLLGKEGPNTTQPSKYIRYIYNRVSLENAKIRSSAVSALAKFGVKLEHLRPSIIVLLKRCLYDNDDEVRDRATFYLNVLEAKDANLSTRLVTEVELAIPMVNLEVALREYLRDPSSTPFDITTVPVDVPEPVKPAKETAPGTRERGAPPAALTPAAPASAEGSEYSQILSQIPQFANYGKLFKSSQPVELSESETEYVVNCVKHIFHDRIVFQFNVTNTLPEQQLSKVMVKMVPQSPDFKVEGQIAAPVLQYNVAGTSYVAVKYLASAYPAGAFTNTLKFIVKEVDPSTGEVDEPGYEDDYHIEDIEVTISDYIKRTLVTAFQEEWDKLGEEGEAISTFNLSTMKTLQDAVKEITTFLGMQPIDRSDQVPPKRSKHILFLAGRFVGDIQVLARARMKQGDAGQGVAMELTVRSIDKDLSTAIASAI